MAYLKDEPISLDDLRSTIRESKDDLARTLKAVSHPKRLEILNLLTDTTKTFVQLLRATKISRTALANHLQQLITRGLIRRLERGSYQVTTDGQELLQAIVESYVDSQIRFTNGHRKLVERYATTRSGMGRNMIKLNELKFKDYAVSHLGALHGCLEYLDIDVTQPWLYGITTHGLMINISVGDVCPSGPTAWKPIPLFTGAKNLGVEFDGILAWPQEMTEAEYAKKKIEAQELVSKALSAGQPCYGWQIGDILDYYIIYGVDDSGYYYKGYFQGEGAGPKPWNEIGQMFIDINTVKKTKPPVDETTQVKEALQAVLRIAANDKEWILGPKYQAGLAGFDAWIDALDKGTAVQMGNAYNAMVWRECRDMGSKFFLEVKERLNGKAKPFLAKASELYGQVAKQLLELSKIYPFNKDQLTMDPIGISKTNQNAVRYLKTARDAEAQGLRVIEKILEVL